MQEEKEWFAQFPRLTILPWLLWAVLIGAAIAGVFYASKVHAAPIYQAEQGGVRVVLTDEDCKLPQVSNLTKRATWTEDGKTFEGCYGGHPMFPIVMAYFSDKSVVALPVEMFVRVTGV